MKAIYKYSFEVNYRNDIKMPRGARPLCVQTQYGKPCIWALVDPNEELVIRPVFTFGTGHPVDIDTEYNPYLGTFQLAEGQLVFHVFVGQRP